MSNKDCNCGEPANFFHSGCCDAHFEGVVNGDELLIVCESCGELIGELKPYKNKK